MKRCKKCGKAYPDSQVFCSECGELLPNPSAVCRKCGAELSDTDVFCSKCGEPVKQSRAAETVCPYCGYALKAGSTFCPHCGTRLPPNQQPHQQQYAQAAAQAAQAPNRQPDLPPMPTDQAKLCIIWDIIVWLGSSYISSAADKYTDFSEALMMFGVFALFTILIILGTLWVLNNYKALALRKKKCSDAISKIAEKNYRQSVKVVPIFWYIFTLVPLIMSIIIVLITNS